MQIKIKKTNPDGIARMETSGKIQDILINEDLLHPDNESVSLCFRGKRSSGIIDLSPAEIEMLYDSVRKRMHLIKGFKRLTGSGAIKL